MRSLTMEANEKRADAILRARRAAADLVSASEKFRKAIDDLDCELKSLIQTGEINKAQRIIDRLYGIRRSRSAMECFALQCLINESIDSAWKEM